MPPSRWLPSSPPRGRASGSATDPWASLEHAARVVPDVGCTVWFETGVYTGTQQIKRRFEHLTVFSSVDDYGAVLDHDDVVIDLYCYRKYGHNEGDEPRFTQPLMYEAVDQKRTVRQVYVDRLVQGAARHKIHLGL